MLLPALAMTTCDVSESGYRTASATSPETIARQQGATKFTVDSDLLFPPGSSQLSPDADIVLAVLIAALLPAVLVPRAQRRIVINGYTDNVPIGPALRQEGITSNQVLSQKRAEAVRQFLISQGTDPGLIAARGYGDADPVASNSTSSGRAENRRVEITLEDDAAEIKNSAPPPLPPPPKS